jgi:RimJ/RimL family protein N-acetyltransferase
MGDAEILYVWRNHPLVVALSTRKITVTWNEHIAWLKSCIGSPDRHRIFIIHSESAGAIGVVRFDRNNDAMARLSIVIDPSHLGCGVGPVSLVEGTQKIFKLWPKLEIVDAQVLADNKRAVRAFQKAGFELQPVGALPGHVCFKCRRYNSITGAPNAR